MFTTMKIVLSTAIILGAASASLAGSKNEDGHNGGGFKVQTWEEAAQARQLFLIMNHLGNAGNAYAYVPSPNRKHGSSYK